MKGFIPYKYPDGQPTPFEYLTVGDATYEVGDGLDFTSGVLELCTATSAPEYICMFDGVLAADTAGKPVIKVDSDVIYESELSVDSDSIAIGTKYTISSTSDKVTATTSSGVAEVVGYEGTKAGNTVYVRF